MSQDMNQPVNSPQAILNRDDPKAPVLMAVTGASGSIYAFKFMEILSRERVDVHLVVSDTGKMVIQHELGREKAEQLLDMAARIYPVDAIGSAPASGSSKWRAMVIIPCTMGTLGAITSGHSSNLIHRAADCFLKERRPLIAVVRETPLNRIHIENMLRLHDAGGIIFPAMPAFYQKPVTLEDIAEYLASRIADFLGVPVQIPRWHGI